MHCEAFCLGFVSQHRNAAGQSHKSMGFAELELACEAHVESLIAGIYWLDLGVMLDIERKQLQSCLMRYNMLFSSLAINVPNLEVAVVRTRPREPVGGMRDS